MADTQATVAKEEPRFVSARTPADTGVAVWLGWGDGTRVTR